MRNVALEKELLVRCIGNAYMSGKPCFLVVDVSGDYAVPYLFTDYKDSLTLMQIVQVYSAFYIDSRSSYNYVIRKLFKYCNEHNIKLTNY